MKERRGRNWSIYSNSETGVAWCKQKIYHSVGGNKSTCIKVLLDEGEEKIIILAENTHWTESDRKGYVLVFLPSPKVEEQQTGLKRKGEEAGEKTPKTDLWPPMAINSTAGTPGVDAVWGWLGIATLLPTTKSHLKTLLRFTGRWVSVSQKRLGLFL